MSTNSSCTTISSTSSMSIESTIRYCPPPSNPLHSSSFTNALNGHTTDHRQSYNSSPTQQKQFIFHSIDPRAQESKRKKDREFMASQTFRGLTFRPSKYMGMMKPSISTPFNNTLHLNIANHSAVSQAGGCSKEQCTNNSSLNFLNSSLTNTNVMNTIQTCETCCSGIRQNSSAYHYYMSPESKAVDSCSSQLPIIKQVFSCSSIPPHSRPSPMSSRTTIPSKVTSTSLHFPSSKTSYRVEKSYHMKSSKLPATSPTTVHRMVEQVVRLNCCSTLPTVMTASTSAILSAPRKVRTSISISELLN
ncbi:hypothetical protein C9374_003589 [Naegleria lovaniensis]|uniref:Uncharacterized protein n=1 Tax=Naegleria lovaniensis TaxID=51637 RepID=A0AA88H375_NAELO|nr:uncharacterized protein C9374_003589 [Naegleria lovaniensis]KAG2393825.1 hypothetical protein C9374_003589 [Naegleria lovaniensis]